MDRKTLKRKFTELMFMLVNEDTESEDEDEEEEDDFTTDMLATM